MSVSIKQNDNNTWELFHDGLGRSRFRIGGQEPPVAGSQGTAAAGNSYVGSSYVKVTLGTQGMTGGLGAVLNPYPRDVIIGAAYLYITAGQALTVYAGTGASLTTFGNNLLDACAITNGSAGVYDNSTDKGTNGKTRQLWSQNTYVTMTATITPATLAGSLYLEVINP